MQPNPNFLREVAREGWLCPECGEPVNECWCGNIPEELPTDPFDRASYFPTKKKEKQNREHRDLSA